MQPETLDPGTSGAPPDEAISDLYARHALGLIRLALIMVGDQQGDRVRPERPGRPGVHESDDAQWRVRDLDGTGTWFLAVVKPAVPGPMEVGAIGPGGYRPVIRTTGEAPDAVSW